jgi:hypothetical protein
MTASVLAPPLVLVLLATVWSRPVTPTSANQQIGIKITGATWKNPQTAVGVGPILAAACDDKMKCDGAVNSMGFPQPSNMPRIKELHATFTCGTASTEYAVNSYEYVNFRIDCNDPTARQPTTLEYFVLEEETQPGFPKSDQKEIYLPSGYDYCWDYMFDLSHSSGTSSSSSYRHISGGQTGLLIKWELSPKMFGGRAWLERIYMVAGHYVSDPAAACPSRP